MTNLEKNASGLLGIAVRRMARSYPFHAHLLLPERFVCVPEVDTIGVTICDARLQFWYAHDFICRCSLDELAASLHHEVNHILFEHLLANPDEFPDQRARIIAEEVTANEWIVEPLPGSPITLDQFPNLPPLEDTETRYARLVGDSMSKGRRTTQLGQETVRSGPDLVQAGRKSARREPKSDRFGEKPGTYPLDNHDIWKSIRVNPLVGRLVISAAVHQAKAQLKPTDWQNVPTTLRDQIDHVIHNVQSSEVINPQGNGAVDWGRVLRQFIAKMLARRPALHRVPRRFPGMIGVVPGKSQSAVRHRVMAVIDTSASMTGCMLERIGGELSQLARECDITVVQCDCEVRAIHTFRGEITEVRGRGNTDLRPPFEPAIIGQVRPDLIIYFTDGDGPAPLKPPAIPTIWCLNSDVRPAPWGLPIMIGGFCDTTGGRNETDDK